MRLVELAYLNYNVWVRGWLADPRLYIVRKGPGTKDETITYVLVDANGNPVTDPASTVFPASAAVKEIVLGDYLDAQFRAKGLGDGFYFILVKNETQNYIWALPLICTTSAISAPSIDPERLQYYTIFDKVLGAYINVPKTVDLLPATDRFEVYAYFKDGNKGRLVKIDKYGQVVMDTGYHQLAVVRTEIIFSSFKEMVTHMLAHSYGLTNTVIQRVLETIDAGDYDTALKLLRPFYLFTWIGTLIDYDFIADATKGDYRIVIRSSVFLGEFDWAKIFKWGALGCGITVAVAMVIAALTAGIGGITAPLVLGACLVGGAIGASLAVEASGSTDKRETIMHIYKIIDEKKSEALQKNQQGFNSAKEILDKWLQEGKITKDDYDQMMKALSNWKTTMDTSIEELAGTAKQAVDAAYDAGYKKGVEESKTWIAVAGVGGLVVGFILGKR